MQNSCPERLGTDNDIYSTMEVVEENNDEPRGDRVWVIAGGGNTIMMSDGLGNSRDNQ